MLRQLGRGALFFVFFSLAACADGSGRPHVLVDAGFPDTATPLENDGGVDAKLCGSDVECDDSNVCTTESCVSGMCVFTAVGCACHSDNDCTGRLDAGECGEAACVGGECIVRPSSEKEGVTCDDENMCTRASACSAGHCLGTDSVSCDEFGTACQQAPRCNPATGACEGEPERDGTPCNADDNGCTASDSCQSGVCVAGNAVGCDDGTSCTTDACSSTGPTSYECASSQDPTSCVIDGACHAGGEADPASSCRVCDASRSTSSWTISEGGSCTAACRTGGSCDATGACVGGTEQLDSYEPNATWQTSYDFGGISDADTFPSGTVSASLYGEGDVDWYVYTVSDDLFSFIWPAARLTGVPAGSDYDLCAYVECTDGDFSALTCDAGERVDDDGPGCCSRNGGSADEHVTLNHTCSGFLADSARIWVKVWRHAGTATCDPYTLEWGDE